MFKPYQIFPDEYPLFDFHVKCQTARFVGGVSSYLCECKKPLECEGVKAVAHHKQIEKDAVIKRLTKDAMQCLNAGYTDARTESQMYARRRNDEGINEIVEAIAAAKIRLGAQTK